MDPETASILRRCERCRADLVPGTKYCGRCGAPTQAHVLERVRAFEAAQQPARAAVKAIAAVVAGVLLSLVAVEVLARLDVPVVVMAAAQYAFFVATGVFALRAMGANIGAAFAPPRSVRPWVEAAAAGLGAIGAGIAYVELLRRVLGAADVEAPDRGVLELVTAVVVAPVIEEWLCRGVLWAACRRVSGTAGTLFVTSVIFAVLHGLNGFSLLETPHRFAAGLLFGWLRARTRSVAPCIAAHALANALGSIWEG